MRHFLLICLCFLLWPNTGFASDPPKNITSSFCKNFTADQIPLGNFQQPLATPLSTMRVTQDYHTNYQEGYCQVGSGQFSAGSRSCHGQKIYYGHDGLDLHPAGSKAGQNNVMSAQNGLVVASHAKGAFSGWGESMIIATRPNQYSEEILTFHYHHLHAVGEGGSYLTTRLFNACEQVKAGQTIAKEGGTPSWPTHLHLSIKRWRNFQELQDRITKSPGLFYGYGYTFGDDGKVANFLDPEGLFFDYYREFNQDQKLYADWQWAKSLTLFMRSKGWEFGLFDGSFGVKTQVKKRDAARWLKIALELPTNTYPLTGDQGKAIFTDLKSNDYDLPYVNTLVQQKQQIKIIDGSHSCVAIGSHFCPDSPVTKAEALKMVIAGFYQYQFLSFYNTWVWKSATPLAQNLLSKFKDVSPHSWYAPFIYFAWQNNLIGGDSYFSPNLPVSKGDLAKWLVLAYQNKHNSQSSFCQKLQCQFEKYCEESTHQCEPIPSCLPKEGLPCPLGGGGSQIPGVPGDSPAADGEVVQPICNCASNQQCVWSGNVSYCQDIPPNCTIKYIASPSGQSCYTNVSASGSPTLCLETKQQSGSGWQWRICKQSGTFSKDYSYLLLDQNHLSHNFGAYFGSAGDPCSNWQKADFSYLNADGPTNGAGLKVQVLSPSNCSSAACTYFSGFTTLYRNCL